MLSIKSNNTLLVNRIKINKSHHHNKGTGSTSGGAWPLSYERPKANNTGLLSG